MKYQKNREVGRHADGGARELCALMMNVVNAINDVHDDRSGLQRCHYRRHRLRVRRETQMACHYLYPWVWAVGCVVGH